MENSIFSHKTGANKFSNPVAIIGFILCSIVIAYILALNGIEISIALFLIPLLIVFFIRLFNEPKSGMAVLYILNYFLLGLPRYIPLTMPIGIVLDIFLLLLILSFFFKHFNVKIDFTPLKNDLVYLSLIWFGYIFLELANPEVVSVAAWYSAMRGEGLYILLVISLVFLLFYKPKNLDFFMYVWGTLVLLATAKAMQQYFISPDPWEQKWLDEGAWQNHILFGKLRAFSFFTDASQFGASMGQSGVVGILMFFNTKNFKKKIFWLIVGLAGLYSMSISGTRSAIAVPIVGFFLYIILGKNIRVIIIGSILMIGVFGFFKYTSIGNGNYQINRMRTAFNPKDDASMELRLYKQGLFADYLKTRPIGGGIGHAGIQAQKYVPNGFLAHIATDSWFVTIWAECGIVGLFLHLFVLFYIVGKGSYIIMFRIKNKDLKAKLSALHCGVFGIIMASYSNAYFGQFPTLIIVATSMTFVFLGPQLEKQIEFDEKEKELQFQSDNLFNTY